MPDGVWGSYEPLAPHSTAQHAQHAPTAYARPAAKRGETVESRDAGWRPPAAIGPDDAAFDALEA